jgi:hypothetical protein
MVKLYFAQVVVWSRLVWSTYRLLVVELKDYRKILLNFVAGALWRTGPCPASSNVSCTELAKIIKIKIIRQRSISKLKKIEFF